MVSSFLDLFVFRRSPPRQVNLGSRLFCNKGVAVHAQKNGPWQARPGTVSISVLWDSQQSQRQLSCSRRRARSSCQHNRRKLRSNRCCSSCPHNRKLASQQPQHGSQQHFLAAHLAFRRANRPQRFFLQQQLQQGSQQLSAHPQLGSQQLSAQPQLASQQPLLQQSSAQPQEASQQPLLQQSSAQPQEASQHPPLAAVVGTTARSFTAATAWLAAALLSRTTCSQTLLLAKQHRFFLQQQGSQQLSAQPQLGSQQESAQPQLASQQPPLQQSSAQPQAGSQQLSAQPQLGSQPQPPPSMPKNALAFDALLSAIATLKPSVDRRTLIFHREAPNKGGNTVCRSTSVARLARTSIRGSVPVRFPTS